MMGPSEISVPAADGTPLIQRTWPADEGSVPAGSLLLVHGLGEHARRYDHVAAALTALGLEVRSYDLRGFGRSGGARGTLPSSSSLIEDLALMFQRLMTDRRAEGDNSPPFVLGHSLGGCLVARAVTGEWIAPRGMVLSSPALIARVSLPERWAVTVGTRLFPNLQVPSRLPIHRVSHDPDVLDAIRADTEMHDRVTPRLIEFLIAAGRAAIAQAPACRVPTLLLVAGDDHFVNPDGARRFASRLPEGVGTLRVYEGLYHEIFNERTEDRARVMEDLKVWIREQLGDVQNPP